MKKSDATETKAKRETVQTQHWPVSFKKKKKKNSIHLLISKLHFQLIIYHLSKLKFPSLTFPNPRSFNFFPLKNPLMWTVNFLHEEKHCHWNTIISCFWCCLSIDPAEGAVVSPKRPQNHHSHFYFPPNSSVFISLLLLFLSL